MSKIKQPMTTNSSAKSGRSKKIIVIVALLVCCGVAGGYFLLKDNVTAQASDLMEGVVPNTIQLSSLDQTFLNATSDFSLSLFGKTFSSEKNTLVSPASAYLALGMTANGANGQTLTEFNTLLGGDSLTVSDLNPSYYTLMKTLTGATSSKVGISNAIWYRNDPMLTIEDKFLQTNADYYGADAYRSDFSAPETVDEINGWVSEKTDGYIRKMVEEVDEKTLMYLMNTVLFEAEWQTPYTTAGIFVDTFTLADGTQVDTDYMRSTEGLYVADDQATGFLKPYKDSEYSFLALLPNEGVSVEQYVQSLDGEQFLALQKGVSEEMVAAVVPKFAYDNEMKLVDPLKNMGLINAFDADAADFSGMGKCMFGNIYIGDVLQKTFIQVDELGTKAGAATKVEMIMKTSIMFPEQEVILNRPFLYAIVENETGLPLFIGSVANPNFN